MIRAVLRRFCRFLRSKFVQTINVGLRISVNVCERFCKVKHMLIGYMRVSTDDQNLDLQRDALRKAGCDKIFKDTASGARDDRTGLAQSLSHLRGGDCLVVWKLDRLGRRMVSLIGFAPARDRLSRARWRLPNRHDNRARQILLPHDRSSRRNGA